MPEQFEFRDLSDCGFWGVDLQRATFRDVDLTGARISHARLTDVDIDAQIDRLVINGVDVTAYVNERDQWFALRSQIHPTDPDTARQGWEGFVAAWSSAIDRAESLRDEARHASVGGEWSFVETVRHLVFATDKWFTVPIAGGAFHPLGLPNTGSADHPWPGLVRSARPTFSDAVDAWLERSKRLSDFLDQPPPAVWTTEVEVLENGPSAVHDCISVVFEEHFQHLRYATRDLDALE